MIKPIREKPVGYGNREVQYKYPAFTGNEPCAGYEDLYLSEEPLEPDQIRQLRYRCSTCPLLDACAAWSIAHEAFGFWAGMTAKDRDEMRKYQRIVHCEPVRNTRVNGDHFRVKPDKCRQGHWVSNDEVRWVHESSKWVFECKECVESRAASARRNGSNSTNQGGFASRHPWKMGAR